MPLTSCSCPICGTATWTDDDLHWQFCNNSRCEMHWSRKEERGFSEAIDDLERSRRERDSENLYYEEFANRHGEYWANYYEIDYLEV